MQARFRERVLDGRLAGGQGSGLKARGPGPFMAAATRRATRAGVAAYARPGGGGVVVRRAAAGAGGRRTATAPPRRPPTATAAAATRGPRTSRRVTLGPSAGGIPRLKWSPDNSAGVS